MTSWCCLHAHGHGLIHWGMDNLPLATLVKKRDSSSSSMYQLPIAPHPSPDWTWLAWSWAHFVYVTMAAVLCIYNMLKYVTTMSYPEDSSSQHPPHPLPLIFFLSPFLWCNHIFLRCTPHFFYTIKLALILLPPPPKPWNDWPALPLLASFYFLFWHRVLLNCSNWSWIFYSTALCSWEYKLVLLGLVYNEMTFFLALVIRNVLSFVTF